MTDFKLITEIIFILFLVAAGVQLIFFVIIYPRLFFAKINQIDETTKLEAVSVVIAAKDEYTNLSKNLPLILQQNYPDYEVVVVNDQSTDDSEFLLKTMQSEYPKLKVVDIKNPVNFFRGKKFPLSIGIKSAKHDILVLTDADCYPLDENWLRNMVSNYVANKEIVLGYGAYESRKGLLDKFIRFDTIRIAINYMAFAMWGMPYMGVGRNLSYRKSLFYKEKGFQNHYKIVSGDDDLFVNHAANSKNTSVALQLNSKTLSKPKKTFSDWIWQKRRHLSTGKHYKLVHLIVLGAFDISYYIFISSAIYLLINIFHPITISILLILRYLVQLLIIKKFMITFGEKKLLLLSPALELIIMVINPLTATTNFFIRNRKWK